MQEISGKFSIIVGVLSTLPLWVGLSIVRFSLRREEFTASYYHLNKPIRMRGLKEHRLYGKIVLALENSQEEPI